MTTFISDLVRGLTILAKGEDMKCGGRSPSNTRELFSLTLPVISSTLGKVESAGTGSSHLTESDVGRPCDEVQEGGMEGQQAAADPAGLKHRIHKPLVHS